MALANVRVICPNLKCRAILSAPDTARGKYVRCRMCGMKVRIPGAKVKAAPAAVVLDESASD